MDSSSTSAPTRAPLSPVATLEVLGLATLALLIAVLVLNGILLANEDAFRRAFQQGAAQARTAVLERIGDAELKPVVQAVFDQTAPCMTQHQMHVLSGFESPYSKAGGARFAAMGAEAIRSCFNQQLRDAQEISRPEVLERLRTAAR